MSDLEILNENERKFKGWVSVEVIDKQGEIIPIKEEMTKVMDAWMERGAPIIDTHTNKIVGRGLNWTNLQKNGKDAILITAMIYDHYKSDDDVWNKIKSGQYTGFSFGGRALEHEDKQMANGGMRMPVRELKDLEAFEVSVVESPANQEALFESINYLAKTDSYTCPSCGKKYNDPVKLAECLLNHYFDKYPNYKVVTEHGKSLSKFTVIDVGKEIDAQKQFAGYSSFADCISQNQDKDAPQAYCGSIYWQVESDKKSDINKAITKNDLIDLLIKFIKTNRIKQRIPGVPRTEEERRERHNALYGEEPPKERQGLGQKSKACRKPKKNYITKSDLDDLIKTLEKRKSKACRRRNKT